jgi:hypothetical protein
MGPCRRGDHFPWTVGCRGAWWWPLLGVPSPEVTSWVQAAARSSAEEPLSLVRERWNGWLVVRMLLWLGPCAQRRRLVNQVVQDFVDLTYG